MYEIKCERIDNEFYQYKSKNRVGQILTLEIWKDSDSKHNVWNVTFYITTKRKHGYQYLKQTGLDGLSSLIWAKTCIIDFIGWYKTSPYKEKKLKLCVYADDKRRMNTYRKGLIPLGFQVEKSKYQTLYLIL